MCSLLSWHNIHSHHYFYLLELLTVALILTIHVAHILLFYFNAVHSHHYFYLLELLTDGSTKVVFALILTIQVATLLPVLFYYQLSVGFMPLGT